MMKVLKAALVGLFLAGVDAEGERSYTDDLGITHTTSIDKPTIVTFAHTAVSLFDYGLGTDQLLGTYGEYVVSGSDFDFEKPEQTSSYNADPEPEDIAKLLQTTNISPECERVPGYCTSFDINILIDLDPDFLVVHGYAGSPWGFSNFTEVELAFPTSKIIYNDVSLEGKDCSTYENCFGKSMIDLIEQYQELAVFLNLEEPEKLKEDMAALCEAATEFSVHMQGAHEKGIRAMAAYVDPSNAFYASPINDVVLRMFEELGMPILHTGKCEDCSMSYYWETIPSTSYFASCSEEQANATEFLECNNDPLYPVDVWLYDHRTRATINNEDFSVVFPDKAILEGQFVEWPIGGRKITPSHAVEILNSVGPSISGFNRLHAESLCIPDLDVTSEAHRQSGEGIKGAGAGDYACFDTAFHNTKYLKGCSSGGEEEETETVPTIVSGACYDMGTHTCGCGPTACNAELCAASDGIWSDRCPDHCTDCGGSVDVVAEEDSHDEEAEEHSESHDDHEGHVHSEHADDEMKDSSANGYFVFGSMAMAALSAVLSW